jgi:hypothetical protein
MTVSPGDGPEFLCRQMEAPCLVRSTMVWQHPWLTGKVSIRDISEVRKMSHKGIIGEQHHRTPTLPRGQCE